jgi:cell division septation protein DedD
MEDKHPIKFSLGQFVILLGVEVVVLALVFLLGARFGGTFFPDFYTKQFSSSRPYRALEPEPRVDREAAPPKSDKLMDTLGEEETEEASDPAEDAPHFQVGEDGEAQPVHEEEWEDEPEQEGQEPEERLTVNKSLVKHPFEKQTIVRFKSSGGNNFAVEVGEYFDELIASKKISTLKDNGYEAYMVIKNDSGSSPVFAVRVGLFGDRQVAEEFATRMSNKQGIELQVVPVN